MFNTKKLIAWVASAFLAFAPAFASAASVINPYRFASSTSYVNSVQHGSITIAAGATSGTATISAVGAKAFLVWQNFNVSTSLTATRSMPRIELTNSTTVTATRGQSDGTGTVTVPFSVVDPTDSLVDSVQAGTIVINPNGTTGTATISSVDTSRSIAFYLGASNGRATSTTSATGTYGELSLTDATTVTATFNASTTYTAGYVVVQFASGAISSIQRIADAYTTSNTTDTKTISSVNTSNAIVMYGGVLSGNSNAQHVHYTRQITSSTNVDVVRADTNASTRTPIYYVVEFASGVLKSKQNGVITMTGVSSNTATISSVNTAKTLVAFAGQRSGALAQGANIYQMTTVLTNSTTVTGTVGTSDAATSAVAYYAAEFN